MMVLLTVIVGGFLSSGNSVSILSLINVAIGVFFIAASGSAWNQYLERYTDFLMPRTARRPLPDRRLTANQVTVFGAIMFGAGVAYLGAVVNVPAMLLAVSMWLLYVCVYTPLKRRTWWNTAVGAVAGAMPVLVGALATGEQINGPAWALFAILFLWQFPHFMAIAWLYRQDYADGGLKMVTVVDPSGRLAGQHAVIVSGVLLVGSMIVALRYHSLIAQAVMLGVGGVAGLWYLLASINFARQLNEASARRLLRVSLVYLPLVMLALVVAFVID
jgi:protoheme IX farnesyltransferase